MPGCAANSPMHSASNANHPRRLRGSAHPVTLPQRSDPVDGRLRRHGGHVNDTVLDVTAQVNNMSILKAGDNGRRRRRDRRLAARRPPGRLLPGSVHDGDRADPAADQGGGGEHRPAGLRPGGNARVRRAPAAPLRGLRHDRREGPDGRDRAGHAAPLPWRDRDLRPRRDRPAASPRPSLARDVGPAGRGSVMTTLLHERAEEYLRLRRALGFRLRHEGYILPQFAGYLEQHGAATVTAEHAIAWAQLPQGVHPVTWTHRLSAVRGFATWLRTVDPATEIPPKGVFPGQGKRPAPFIFTSEDLAAVVAGCAVLRPAMRAAACTALFGLIAVTGIRIGEALAIPADGIDLDAGLLPVMPAKSRCQRILPLHPTTAAALKDYDALRARAFPGAATFFVSEKGTPLNRQLALTSFRKACAAAGIPGRPRIHDARHSFAANTLLEWYRSGEDVAAQMPALSGYLGHTTPEGTFWYISAVPELMQLAAARASGKDDGDE